MTTIFESADSDKPEEIIKATQKALIQAMRNIITDMKKDVGGPWDAPSNEWLFIGEL